MELTDLENLSSNLGALLLEKKMYITCAESCTGGLLSQSIVSVAGSSAWFGCSFITYSNHSKHKMLGVSKDSLKSFGAVSEEVVGEMVNGALSESRANLGIAISGIAGPGGGSKLKPVGLVYIGIKTGKYLLILENKFKSRNRSSIQKNTVREVLKKITKIIS